VPKFLIDVNNDGKKYNFNFYSVHEYEDGAVSEDTRLIESDDFADFVRKLNNKLKRDERVRKQKDKV
jgi:hypothetical protein